MSQSLSSGILYGKNFSISAGVIGAEPPSIGAVLIIKTVLDVGSSVAIVTYINSTQLVRPWHGGTPLNIVENCMNKASDFVHGDKVTYIPGHAHGDPHHEDCESGVVSSVNDHTVFVKYDCLLGCAITGNEPWTAKGTNPKDLILESNEHG